MCVIPAAHLLINLQLQFDAATDTAPFRPQRDLCQTQPKGKRNVSTGTKPLASAWLLQLNRLAVFISHQNVSATGPSETSNSTYLVTQPHISQDVNQGMSPPATLVDCQLMRLIHVKLDHFSCCERSYRTTTLSNCHKNTFPTSQKKYGSPLQRQITVCCLCEKSLCFLGVIRTPYVHHIGKIQGF